MYETLILKQSEVKELSNMKEIIGYVETAYSYHARRKVQMPAKKYLFFKKYEGDLRVMPCFIRGLDMAGVKNVNVHPNNQRKYNLPTVMEGTLDPVIEPLMTNDLEEKLAALKA